MPTSITEYNSRNTELEPDTVAKCELCPSYFLVGTYSLVEGQSESEVASKEGSLEVYRLSSNNGPSFGAMEEGVVDKKDFPFGIYDMHFHPELKGLLGIATSDAEILLYQLMTTTSLEEPKEILYAGLVPLGRVTVEESQDEVKAIITQFQFLSGTSPKEDVAGARGGHEISLAATTQFGNTKLFRITIPEVEQVQYQSVDFTDPPLLDLDSISWDIHKQSMGLEAWTVCSIRLDGNKTLFVSGGDDSQMIGSVCELDQSEAFLSSPVTRVFLDRRTHEAGVVSLLCLGREQVRGGDGGLLLLSGSYDEKLRFFEIDANTLKPKLKAELKLPGGVWRIYLMDEYLVSDARHYVLLIAAHLGGAFIVRLVQIASNDPDTASWKFGIEAEFTAGHQSLVYACIAFGEDMCKDEKKQHSILSTSFYDKQVCYWKWIDESTPLYRS